MCIGVLEGHIRARQTGQSVHARYIFRGIATFNDSKVPFLLWIYVPYLLVRRMNTFMNFTLIYELEIKIVHLVFN
jgi:hypothetical protein